MANRMGEDLTPESLLGTYLKDRRAKLDPAAFGFSPERRRTPGLRREEVAQRANVSATWYTWLEQGRAGPHRPRANAHGSRARAYFPVGARQTTRSPLSANRDGSAATATPAGCAGIQSGFDQELHLGRDRLEPRR